MTNVSVQTASRLLDKAADIVGKYDALYRETGLKYNIFKAARISADERVMCRVIADLLDPGGSHYRGNLYLRLFWKGIKPKLKSCPPIDYETARVHTEYLTSGGRRIDIAIEDGKIFVPIEVKIWAADQEKQVADYAAFAREKNGDIPVPVLYLTLDGHAPTDAGEKDYICLSFGEDITAWLAECLNQKETQAPVREIMRELIEAVKSLCGKPEDEEMEKELRELVCKSEDAVRAALAISGVVAPRPLVFQNEQPRKALAYAEFMGPILDLVRKSFPGAHRLEGRGLNGIYVPVKEGRYFLFVNFDWWKLQIDFAKDRTANSKLEAALGKKMSEVTGYENNSDGSDAFFHEGLKYPTLSSAGDDIYHYRLYLLYKENPREAADRIIRLARALEEVRG